MRSSTLLILIIFFLAGKVSGQTVTANENAMLDKFIQSQVMTDKEKIVSDSLEKVFNGTFFRFKIGASTSEGDSWCITSLVVLLGGKLIEFDNRTDSILPLLSLAKNDFYLKTESDARIVEAALTKLYPPSEFSDEKPERIKMGNSWYFIRGKFFDSKSGYIVSLDKNFRISNIAYSMEAIKK